ncbi:hypothetical protein L7F22_045831 [Adiantum nelumboides]|nr:hypothetical protein [Adiantum nelumboides]
MDGLKFNSSGSPLPEASSLSAYFIKVRLCNDNEQRACTRKRKHRLVKMWSVGKIKLILPPNPIKLFDIWSGETTDFVGRLRLRDVRAALDADVIFYVDEGGSQVLISAHDRGILQGYSTSLFKCNQELVIVCRKDIGRRAKNAIVPMMLPSSSGAGTSSISFKNVEGMEKLLQLRKQLKDEVQEIDNLIEKLLNMRMASWMFALVRGIFALAFQ